MSRLARSDRIGPGSANVSDMGWVRTGDQCRSFQEPHHQARRRATIAGRRPCRSGTLAARSGSLMAAAAGPVALTVKNTGTFSLASADGAAFPSARGLAAAFVQG